MERQCTERGENARSAEAAMLRSIGSFTRGARLGLIDAVLSAPLASVAARSHGPRVSAARPGGAYMLWFPLGPQ